MKKLKCYGGINRICKGCEVAGECIEFKGYKTYVLASDILKRNGKEIEVLIDGLKFNGYIIKKCRDFDGIKEIIGYDIRLY